MKKVLMLAFILISVLTSTSPIFATDVKDISSGSSVVEEVKDNEQEKKHGNASDKTINNVITMDEKREYYKEKCGGDAVAGNVMYVLNEIQRYSIPVFFIGMVIASLNFFIIGNKKLDKKEKGLKMLVACIVGLIVFQALPLLFAIVVAGR